MLGELLSEVADVGIDLKDAARLAGILERLERGVLLWVDGVELGGGRREVQHGRLAGGEVFLDFLDRAAGITARRRTESCPEDADEQVGVLENSLVDDLLWLVAHFWSDVGLPAERQQHHSATRAVDRV